jgi:DHA1 family quinolone resistance protein-like MFS transporter
MISDIFVLTGFGLIAPILAIFIKENLVGGTIFSAGLATTIFVITKSMVQLPFSKYVDKHDDKLKWLIIGLFITSTVPFLYIFATNIKMIYIAQIIYGVGSGLAFPTWLGLWSRNLDKKQESFEWSLYSTLVGLGTAVTAAIGGAIAQFIGFNTTFIIVGILSIIGSLILFKLKVKDDKKKVKLIHYLQKKYISRNEDNS